MSEKAKNICWRCRKYQYGGFLRLLYDKDNSRLWTIGIYLLLFCLWIDAVVTIINRLIKKKENIFQPHRSHLYQYLANEMGILMFCCDCLCGTQLGINGIIIYKATNGSLSLYFVLGFYY
jgi:hypothetical protein